jgi:DNA replication protein
MKTFAGFTPGPSRPIALPEAFFTDLLPLIDDLGELQVTLACFRIVTHKSGSPRAIRWADLADEGLRAMMDEDSLRAGLELAVTRGTLLYVRADVGDGPEELYFINTERGREAARTLQRGERPEGLAPAEPPASEAERPNIFRQYEQNIGLLTTMLADELRDAEATYPMAWIEDAFRQAVRQNARSWAYVRKILERRERSEKRGARGRTAEERHKYLEGEHADQPLQTGLAPLPVGSKQHFRIAGGGEPMAKFL